MPYFNRNMLEYAKLKTSNNLFFKKKRKKRNFIFQEMLLKSHLKRYVHHHTPCTNIYISLMCSKCTSSRYETQAREANKISAALSASEVWYFLLCWHMTTTHTHSPPTRHPDFAQQIARAMYTVLPETGACYQQKGTAGCSPSVMYRSS